MIVVQAEYSQFDKVKKLEWIECDFCDIRKYPETWESINSLLCRYGWGWIGKGETYLLKCKECIQKDGKFE